MCKLKYIGSFITVLFIQPMNVVMLQYTIILIQSSTNHTYNTNTVVLSYKAIPAAMKKMTLIEGGIS